MNGRRLLILILLCSRMYVHAQLNESDSLRFQLRSSLTGNDQHGNVNLLSVRSRIDFSVNLYKYFILKSQNSSLYQEFGSIKADNDVFSRNYLYFKPQNRIYPFGIVYLSSNYRRKIDTRFFAGAGATVQVLNKKLNAIKFSASTMYETTSFRAKLYNYSDYNGSQNINLWRATLYFGGWHYVLKNRMRIFYDAFGQFAFKDPHNYRTQYELGIDFPIWAGLSATSLYVFTHENVTIKNIHQDDRILTFGLSYFKKIF